MSSNVGLTTPRGSGTSGYVQRNLAHLRPRDNKPGQPYPSPSSSTFREHRRQPDAEILEHDRKREIELKIFELRDRLEDEEVAEEEIEKQTEELREKLNRDAKKGGKNAAGAGKGRNLKMHQVHELAEAKIHEDERMRRALGISRDYEEGSHWRKQEERLKGALEREQGESKR